MVEKKSFEERYRENNTPWEINRVDHNLSAVVSALPIMPGKALDIGCGTGDNSIWLAGHHFQVTGCDISPDAIARAKAKAAMAAADCRFLHIDFLKEDLPGAPFSFVFDRGCFHTTPEGDRRRFVARVAALLEGGGTWLSMIGNADEIREEEGPPQLSALQIVTLVEPFFEIISLASCHFDSDMAKPPRGWLCRMKKR